MVIECDRWSEEEDVRAILAAAAGGLIGSPFWDELQSSPAPDSTENILQWTRIVPAGHHWHLPRPINVKCSSPHVPCPDPIRIRTTD